MAKLPHSKSGHRQLEQGPSILGLELLLVFSHWGTFLTHFYRMSYLSSCGKKPAEVVRVFD